MPPVGLEPAIPASEQPQTHILDQAATGIAMLFTRCCVPVLLNFTWQFSVVVCLRTGDGVYLEAGFLHPSCFDSWLLWRWSLQTGRCTLLSKCEHCNSVSVCCILSVVLIEALGPGTSVGIATDYGLDGPGSIPGGDEIFRPSRPALGSTQPPVKWVPGLSGGKVRPVRAADRSTPSSAAVMEE